MRLVDGHVRLHLVVPASAAVITARNLADNLAKADDLERPNLPGQERGGFVKSWRVRAIIADRRTPY